jgi:hypothetical protein
VEVVVRVRVVGICITAAGAAGAVDEVIFVKQFEEVPKVYVSISEY